MNLKSEWKAEHYSLYWWYIIILKVFHLCTEKKTLDIALYSRNFMQSTSGSRPKVSHFSSPDSVQFLLSFNYMLQNPLSLTVESRN